MSKLKLFWAFVVASALGMLALFFGKKKIEEQAKQDASKELAENLKAKVAEIKAAAAERKAETDVAVAKVDEAAKADAARDSVDLANDLISGKGG